MRHPRPWDLPATAVRRVLEEYPRLGLEASFCSAITVEVTHGRAGRAGGADEER